MTSCQLGARSHAYSSTSSTPWQTENCGRRSAMGGSWRLIGRVNPCIDKVLVVGIGLRATAGVPEVQWGPASYPERAASLWLDRPERDASSLRVYAMHGGVMVKLGVCHAQFMINARAPIQTRSIVGPRR